MNAKGTEDMEGYRLIPEKYRVLSNSGLKVIAVIAMLLDHTASALLWDDPTILFTLHGTVIGYYEIFRTIGRISFPIYAFLLVEGFHHTGNRKSYGLRLLLFALISEVPWNLMHAGSVLYAGQNVFFTLFLGYLGLCVMENLKTDEDKIAGAAQLIVLLALSILGHADYGCNGFGFILFLDLARRFPVYRAVVGTCFLTDRWRAGMAFIPVACYNGRRGFINTRPLQLLFYAIYPLHLLILFFIKTAYGRY